MTKGFTLIELLVYIAVLFIVLTLTVQFTLAIMDSSARANAKDEVYVNAAAVIREFTFTTREAQAVYDPTSDFVGDPGHVSLVATRDLPPDETETYVDMYLDNGRFCVKRELSGVACLTTPKVIVTSLTFQEITQTGGAESLQMIFTIRFLDPRPKYYYEQTIQTTVRLRPY